MDAARKGLYDVLDDIEGKPSGYTEKNLRQEFKRQRYNIKNK